MRQRFGEYLMKIKPRNVTESEELEDLESLRASIFAEFLQLEIAHIRYVLKIKQAIIVITNQNLWHIYYPELAKNMFKSYARLDTEDFYIFLNVDNVRSLRRLKLALWHEAFHIKYPKLSERKIRRMVKEKVLQ